MTNPENWCALVIHNEGTERSMGTEQLTEEYRKKPPWLFRNVTQRFPILGGYTRILVSYRIGHENGDDTLMAYLFVCSKPTNMLSISIWLGATCRYQNVLFQVAGPKEADRVTTSDSWVMRRRLSPSAGSLLIDRTLSCHSGDVSDEG